MLNNEPWKMCPYVCPYKNLFTGYCNLSGCCMMEDKEKLPIIIDVTGKREEKPDERRG